MEGHGRARWRPGRTRSSARGHRWWRAARGEARALMSRGRADAQGKTNRRRREEEEGGGVRRGRKGGDRSAPGTGGYIPGRFTPDASHQSGVKVLYSRCVLPTGSKGPFTPGAYYQPGVKVYLSSRLVTCTGSKGFFLWATELQPTFTPGWASHPGVKVACSFVSRLF